QLPFYRKPSRQCLLELIARSDCLGLNTQQGKTGAKKPQPANRPNNWSAIKKNEQLRMILEKESVLVPKIEGWRHSTSLCRFCLASRSRKRALGSRWVSPSQSWTRDYCELAAKSASQALAPAAPLSNPLASNACQGWISSVPSLLLSGQ